MSTTYVIVRPGGWGHASDNPKAHLVVNVDEWVKVLHKEKGHYDFVVEHDEYNSAHHERNRLNRLANPVREEAQPEIAVEDENHGIQWMTVKTAS